MSQIDTGHLFETLLSFNRMLMMDLQNLILAIALEITLQGSREILPSDRGLRRLVANASVYMS